MPLAIDPYEPVLTIGSVAKQLGVSVQTVRMYADEGLIVPHKTKSGQRRFSVHDLDRLTCMRHMITDHGLNLKGIKQMMALIPCWEYRGGLDDDCRSCPVYSQMIGPCWSVRDVGHKCRHENCRDCRVYRLRISCEEFKEIIHGPGKRRAARA